MKKRNEKLSIIIPIYNEAKTVDILLKKVENVKLPIKKEIIIVESNSTDGSREIVKEHEKKVDKVIYEDRPYGKGHAIKEAFKKVTGTIILIQDADLEYDVRDYPKLLKPILDGKAKFVLGSRTLGKKQWDIRSKGIGRYYSLLLNIGGYLYNSLLNLLYGVHLTDQATMFKVFRTEVIKGIKFTSTSYFGSEIELVVKPIKKGIIPIDVPVRYKARSTAEGKKIRFWRDGIQLLWAIIKYRFVD